MQAPLLGLVLGGGRSRRMGEDKSNLNYHGRPQIQVAYDLVQRVCPQTWISIRPDQSNNEYFTNLELPLIEDRYPDQGPLAAIVSALEQKHNSAWLVVACDLPFLNLETIQYLINERDTHKAATAYLSSHDGLPEPLCAIWEYQGLAAWQARVTEGLRCARKALISTGFKPLVLNQSNALENINTREEKLEVLRRLQKEI